MRLTRRDLVRGLLLIFGISGCSNHRAAAGRASTAPPGLSSTGLDDLLAFAEVVVASGTFSSDERRDLADHLEHRLQRAPDVYPLLYRTAISLLERLAGRPFSRLDAVERVALVDRHRLRSPRVWPDEDLGEFPDDARAVRTQVVPDLVGAYYASAAGWAVVGYRAFPGRCSDLARYTRPEP